MSYFSMSSFGNLFDCEALISEATYIFITLDSPSSDPSSGDCSVEGGWLYAGFANRPPIWLAQFESVADICTAADAIQADYPSLTVWYGASKDFSRLPAPCYYYLADLCVTGDGLADLLREHRQGTCPAGDPRIMAHLQIRDRWYVRAAFGVGAHHLKAEVAPRVQL